MDQLTSWFKMIPELEWERLVLEAVEHASSNLSEMAQHAIQITAPEMATVPLVQVSEYAGKAETEMAGVYLLIEGDLRGQTLLMLEMQSALRLVDLLMNLPAGTSAYLGDMERSALGELGNVTVSSFLNAIVERTGLCLRPSPPAVMVDMQGAILDVIAATAALVSDDLLIVQTNFYDPALVAGQDTGRIVQARFWVLPDPVIEPGFVALHPAPGTTHAGTAHG